MAYRRIVNKSNLPGVTSEAGNVHPYEHVSLFWIAVGFAFLNLSFSV